MPQPAQWVKLGALRAPCLTQFMAAWSMEDAVHHSRMIIIRIVLYTDRFDVYGTNAGDIMIRTVLNRRDVSGQDVKYMHPLEA